MVVPTQNPRQLENSQKLESYLREQNYILLADGVKASRDAIAAKDLNAYKAAAKKTKTALSALSQSEKEGIESWAVKNLK